VEKKQDQTDNHINEMDAHGDEHTIETPLRHYGDGVAAVAAQ